MKMKNNALLAALSSLVLVTSTATAAPVILDTNKTVGGTTYTDISLTAGDIATNNADLSNDGITGNLIVALNQDDLSNTDFNLDWVGAGDGVGFNTGSYSYVQIDIAATSSGLVESAWQMFWQDDDSTVGGGTNSSTGIGSVDPTQSKPFSVIIDLVNGSSNGATGWGPGTLDIFRLDVFNNNTNNVGESFEISAITFGTELVPEPSSLALLGLGGLCLIKRRR